MLSLPLDAARVIELLHNTYNEVIAVTPTGYSCLGVYPREGASLEFRAFKGKFQESLRNVNEINVFSSFKPIDYVEAALTKDLELIETPLGLGPKHWYLAIKCEVSELGGSDPVIYECVPREAFYRPAPPPSRSFFYVLEAAVYASRWFLKPEYVDKAVELLLEGYRLGDELDRAAVGKVLRYLMERV